MSIVFGFNDVEARELRMLLLRALNTLEPATQPKWAQGLSDRLDKHLGVSRWTTSGHLDAKGPGGSVIAERRVER